VAALEAKRNPTTGKVSVMSDSSQQVSEKIDEIESAYEFMLAYAAQGRTEEIDEPEGIRAYLRSAETAIEQLTNLRPSDIGMPNSDTATAQFLELVASDAARASTIIHFVLRQPSIGSQLIDNLNASIHIRTLLTDLFVLDEAIAGQ